MANNNNTMEYRRLDDVLKTFLGVVLTGILLLLAWLASAFSAQSVAIAQLAGKIEITNTQIEFLKREISGLPKKHELATTNIRLDSLESRLQSMEGWIATFQRSNMPKKR